MSNLEYNFWDDRTHELDIHPCKGCTDFVDGECSSNGACGKRNEADTNWGGRMSDYKKVLDRLDMLKDYCFEMEKQQKPGMWKLDGLAVQEAMDIIHDYESVVASHNRMVAHYETADMTIKRQAGVYVCPNCGKRVQVGHSHCHWCGKKVQWDREAYASRDYPHLGNRGGNRQ